MQTQSTFTEPLRELLEHAPPKAVAAIGTLAASALDTQAEELASAELSEFSWEEADVRLPEIGMQDLAVASIEGGTPPERATAEPVLAALRDIYARRIMLLVSEQATESAPWRNSDLVGLGFTRIGVFAGPRGAVTAYGFDIATYKTTPDWLNPRFWAHPQLWGKYRW